MWIFRNIVKSEPTAQASQLLCGLFMQSYGAERAQAGNSHAALFCSVHGIFSIALEFQFSRYDSDQMHV